MNREKKKNIVTMTKTPNTHLFFGCLDAETSASMRISSSVIQISVKENKIWLDACTNHVLVRQCCQYISLTSVCAVRQLVFFSLHLFTYLFIRVVLDFSFSAFVRLPISVCFFSVFVPYFVVLSVLSLSLHVRRRVLHFSCYYACSCHSFNFIYIGPSFLLLRDVYTFSST